jgi:hypothetical protein
MCVYNSLTLRSHTWWPKESVIHAKFVENAKCFEQTFAVRRDAQNACIWRYRCQS